MKIPENAIIPSEKFSRYLLVKREFDDKSLFLGKAGYTLENCDDLIAHIQVLISHNEAIKERTDEYGTFYRLTGILPGINKQSISVTTVWMQRKMDGRFLFITLFPERSK